MTADDPARSTQPTSLRGSDACDGGLGPDTLSDADRPPMAGLTGDLVAGWAPAVQGLLAAAHLMAAHELPGLVAEAAARFEAQDAVIYLVDLQQARLVPFLGSTDAGERNVHALPVDGSMAGLTYQRVQVLTQPQDGGTRVWLPLLNGTERLGVLGITVPHPISSNSQHGENDGDGGGGHLTAGAAGKLTSFAGLVAELVMTKTMYGDTLVLARRAAAMGLAAEMQWGLLPPLTFASRDVVVAAALEPAYEVAGDSVDYAADEGRVRLAVFDGMGHGLQSAQLAVLAVTAYRHARRTGKSLVTTVTSVDAAVHEVYGGEAFVTALFAELDTDTGLLSWVSAGHPEPLLVRDGRIVKHLSATPGLPLGLGAALGAHPVENEEALQVAVEQLQPGDQVVAFTDGVVEAPSPDGDRFGEDRLVDLLTRNLAGGLAEPETMRRVVRALLEHKQAQLTDDATLLLLAWRSAPHDTLLPDLP